MQRTGSRRVRGVAMVRRHMFQVVGAISAVFRVEAMFSKRASSVLEWAMVAVPMEVSHVMEGAEVEAHKSGRRQWARAPQGSRQSVHIDTRAVIESF